MIKLTPTFLSEYHNLSRGFPNGTNTVLSIPDLKPVGKKTTVAYVDKAYLKNPVFPVELYEYRRGKNMKLSIDGEAKSLFAEGNLAKNIYKNEGMKTKVTNLVDLCRQYMNNELEWQIDDEVKYFESMEEADDQKSLEYHYDLRETIKAFNDFLTCQTF